MTEKVTRIPLMTRRGNMTTIAQVEHSYDLELNVAYNMIRESWTNKFVLRAYPSYRKIV